MAASTFQRLCPYCEADLTIKVAQVGKKYTCSECQRRFVVEDPDQEAGERSRKNRGGETTTTTARPKTRKSGKKPSARNGKKKWLIAGGVAAAVVLLVGSVLSAIFLLRGPSRAPAAVVNPAQDNSALPPTAAGDRPSAANLAAAKPGATTPSVRSRARPVPWIDTLSDNFGTYYLVSNGPVQFQLYTTGPLTGQMASLKFEGRETLDDKKKGYAEWNGSFVDSTTKKSTPFSFAFAEPTSFSYRTGIDFIDIAMAHPPDASTPLNLTFHYVVRKEENGFHFYSELRHDSGQKAVSVSQGRLVLHTDEKLFRYASVEDDLSGYQPTSAERSRGRKVNADTIDMRGVQSEYTKLYYTKYQWAACARDHTVDGLVGPSKDAGNNHGIWCVWTKRSKEAMHGGPTRCTPTVDGNTLVYEYASAHQEKAVSLEYTGNYKKTYGPFFVYLNQGNDLKSLREDANRQCDVKNQEAFYDKLKVPEDVKSTERKVVAGQVRLSTGGDMNGAVVVLSTFDPSAKRPIDNEFQRQGKGFNYWTNADKDGRFTLPQVRPGLYRLTVYKPGVYSEFHHDNVRVEKKGKVKLSALTWTPESNGRVVWQIGTFDRSAGEFKHGDESRTWYAAYDFNKDFASAVPGDNSHPRGAVVYTVDPKNSTNDTAQWRSNWNYIQWRSFRYDKPDPNDANKVVEDVQAKQTTQPAGTEPDWMVKFNLDRAPAAKATYTLSIGLAGTNGVKTLTVRIGSHHLDFPLQREDDSGSLRSGVSSRALYQKLTFPGSWLKQGTNTLAFHLDGGELMYDAVRLEVRGEAQTPFTLKVQPGSLTLKAGDRATVTVVATRKDYQGPINVEMHNLPGHVHVARGVIPAGQNQATLQVTVDARATRAERIDVHARGTATAASNQHVNSGNVTVSVLGKTMTAKPPKPTPAKPPKTPTPKKPSTP